MVTVWTQDERGRREWAMNGSFSQDYFFFKGAFNGNPVARREMGFLR
jgi:hypothetical protein